MRSVVLVRGSFLLVCQQRVPRGVQHIRFVRTFKPCKAKDRLIFLHQAALRTHGAILRLGIEGAWAIPWLSVARIHPDDSKTVVGRHGENSFGNKISGAVWRSEGENLQPSLV